MENPTQQVARAFDRAVRSYEKAAHIQQMIAKSLAGILPENSIFERVFEFGVGTGFLTCELLHRCRIKTLLLNDLSPKMLTATEEAIVKCLEAGILHRSPAQIEQFSGNVEVLSREAYKSVDLIASSSALQWLAEPFLFLAKAAEALRPNGTLLIATFGAENLREIRTLTGNGLDYPTKEAYQQFYRKYGFEEFVYREEHLTVHFSSARDVLRHLKDTGVTQLPHFGKRLEGRKAIESFCQEYETRYASEHGVTLSYHPLFLCGKKKH